MKILYVGPYRQNDGWGLASRDLAMALSKSVHEVAARPLYMTSSNITRTIPEEVKKLEENSFPDYDVVIQHTFPVLFDYNGKFNKNVGSFFSETNHLEYTPWPRRCNLMDEIWVTSEAERQHLKTSLVTKPIKKVNMPIDVSKFEKTYPKFKLPTEGKTFNFYFIGEWIERKNIPALLLAFHLEFGRQEPVNLVLKTGIQGLDANNSRQRIEQDIMSLKQSFGIYNQIEAYKPEMLITDYLPDDMLYGLHAACDCLVMPSRGEAWCRPAIDALGFGKTPIVTDGTGMNEFVNNDNGWLVSSTESPVLCLERRVEYLNKARETWNNIEIIALRKAMREAYENKNERKVKAAQGVQDAYNYSYDKIAEQINESC